MKKKLIIIFLFSPLLIINSCNVFKTKTKHDNELEEYKEIKFPKTIYFKSDITKVYDKDLLNDIDSLFIDSVNNEIAEFWLIIQLCHLALHDKEKLKLTLISYSNKLGDTNPSEKLALERNKNVLKLFNDFDSCVFEKYIFNKSLIIEQKVKIDSLTKFERKSFNTFEQLKARKVEIFIKFQ